MNRLAALFSTTAFGILAGSAVLPGAALADEAPLFDVTAAEFFAPPWQDGGTKPGGGGSDDGGSGDDGTSEPPASSFPYYPWMHPDVQPSWTAGYTGVGATVTIIDSFAGGTTYRGNLDGGRPERKTHGEWVYSFASMVAPKANYVKKELDFATAPTLGAGLDVINLSYGLYDAQSDGNYYEGWMYEGNQLVHLQEQRVVQLAWEMAAEGAVVVKAAGNGNTFGIGQPVGTVATGQADLLAWELFGAPNAIFAGALDANGSKDGAGKGTGVLATYSNFPGADPDIQGQFLVVGVDAGITGLQGTSFAAPIVSAYAAMVADKFTEDAETQPSASAVASHLLATARDDTIANYSIDKHGQGEASLERALAPLGMK